MNKLSTFFISFSFFLNMKRKAIEDTQPSSPPPAPKKQALNVIRFMYDQVESMGHGYSRREKDSIYAFIAADSVEFKKNFLNPMAETLMNTYGPKALANEQNPDGLGGLEEREYQILRRIIDNPKNVAAQNALFFGAFYFLPSFNRFFLEGNPEKKEPPPPVADRTRLDRFIRVTLREKCEDLFNGRIGGTNAVNIFVESLYGEYISQCGVPVASL